MKSKDLFLELTDIAKQSGIIIRKEAGAFKSGYCLVEDKKIIMLNRMASVEYMSKIIALGLNYFGADQQYLKPVIREFIDNELAKTDTKVFQIDVAAPISPDSTKI